MKSLIFKMTQPENQSKNRKKEGLKTIKIADEAPRSPEGAKMSAKESLKEAQRRLATIGATVFLRTLAPGGRRGALARAGYT